MSFLTHSMKIGRFSRLRPGFKKGQQSMKTRTLIISFAMLLISAVGCDQKGSESSGHHDAHSAHESASLQSPGTKIVPVGDYQFVFDFMTMENHMKMMKAMNVDMKHNSGATHAIMLTINTAQGKPLKGAVVHLTVTDPDGGSVSKKTEVMEGGQMYHYGTDLLIEKTGEYLVKADVEIQGEMINGQAKFTLPL